MDPNPAEPAQGAVEAGGRASPAPSGKVWAAGGAPRRRLLYLVTEDWYFCSHRLPLAQAALQRGFEVAVATRVGRHEDTIRRAGIRVIPIGLRRSGLNPFKEATAAAELCRLYAAERPDIVHHVAAKPVLYGSLAARRARVPAVVNAMAGLGFAFISRGCKAAALKALLSRAYRWAMSGKNTMTIFQNEDDIKLFMDLGIIEPGNARLIRGSGVDLDEFPAVPEPRVQPDKGPVVLLASRLLWDKGVGEFIDAARKLRASGVKARFVLAGDSDPDNPASIPREAIARWRDQGLVDWRGWRDDMPETFAHCHVVCLPSYREGLPKVLLEAAASSRPIVATDVPGCREIVRHEENGLLVAPRDPGALAAALSRLIRNHEERERFGRRGREIAQAQFSVERVIEQTLDLYEELLRLAGRPA
ncbi:MAG: glycosyltransferase family 4 protein [Elusimicrobia bacterium]|nr:glycosyltransferase family 4 protein [Elusimicrobiota bacterium]